jgi:hypothetical protein
VSQATILVEQHDALTPRAPVHKVQDADLVLIAHGDGSVTCCKDRTGVTYRRRPRNQIPEAHMFAIEDREP